ncbi:AraC family transcriptional regulator, partial [Listeria monocytogenes]|nr:AraC family transcriptional regulator [Listeria monocytogenes]
MFLESKKRIEFFFNDCLLTDFTILNFGHENCLPSHSFGPQVREYFILHYIIEGKGTYSFGNHQYHLKKGDFFLISPQDSDPIYQADATSPWEYVWFGFEGTLAENVLRELGYHNDNRVGHFTNPEKMNNELQQLISTDFFSKSSTLTIQGKLLELISLLSLDGTNVSLNSNMSQVDKHIEQFVLYVRQNYWREELSVQKIAEELNLNHSYLSRIISKKFHQSALNYLIKYRLLKGRFLVENSDHTIATIAKA